MSLVNMERGLPTLLIEDNDDDAFLFQRAFQKIGLNNVFKTVSSGEDSLNYLRGKGIYSDRKEYPFPSVIFMALSSPDAGGFEVLEWLRRHPECNVIPVILFSSMKRDDLVKKAFTLGVHGFFEKPFETEKLEKELRQIYDYWSMSSKPKVPPNC